MPRTPRELKPAPLPGVTWTGGASASVITLKLPNVPAKYRRAVAAGCNAAA